MNKTQEWKKLKKSTEPMTSTVHMDEITEDLIRPFDYSSEGVEVFYPYLIPEDLPKDFNLGVIVGASGTGKSTLLKNFGTPSTPQWGEGSIASHFVDALDANERFSAAGLMSVPEWVKPYYVLSNGQRFRADLARSIGNDAVIDEFTSVIDRNVAKAASTSMTRYIRKNNIKRMVLATVHRDILEFLQPDWIIDTDRGEWSNGRWLQRPDLVIDVYPAQNSIWEYFASYHYLSEKLNKASHNYVAVWEEQLVGFVSSMSYPSGTVKKAFREHRLVIHPDYQGFGMGPRLSEIIAQHYIDNGKRYFSKTSHPRLGGYRDQSRLWKPTSKNHMKRKDGVRDTIRWQINPDRWSYSHEYIGSNNNLI
jgi:GNAT superfamily N-acetyltransferase